MNIKRTASFWALSALWKTISLFYWIPGFLAAVRLLRPSLTSRKRIHVSPWDIEAHTADRALALLMWKHGVLGQDEIALAEKHIPIGGHVVDIGANIGYFSLQLSRIVTDAGHVYAFEPESENFKTLSENLQLNKVKNIRALNLAVSDQTGADRLRLSSENMGDHRLATGSNIGRSETIKSVRLDDFFSDEERIDFVKIDVQGAECRVLRGGRQFFASRRDILVLTEYSPRLLREAGEDPDSFVALAKELGFMLYAFDSKARIRKYKPSRNGFREPNINILLKKGRGYE